MSRKKQWELNGICVAMIRKIIITFALLVGIITTAEADEIVTFKGPRTENGAFLTLTGQLTRPKGAGPFPAVVLLHGCSGLNRFYHVWAERLEGWGYVALRVDSFGPRGAMSCNDFEQLLELPEKRTQDAYAAKSFLSGLSYVDRNRIGVMGWSHGGWTVLATLNAGETEVSPFKAAVALYPFCGEPLKKLNAPLLILTGELDDRCPARLCASRMPAKKTEHEIILKIYPGAYHCFDWEGVDMDYMGHRLLYHPVAAADARVRVREFLAKYLK
jgi:dienelactone hydrolase